MHTKDRVRARSLVHHLHFRRFYIYHSWSTSQDPNPRQSLARLPPPPRFLRSQPQWPVGRKKRVTEVVTYEARIFKALTARRAAHVKTFITLALGVNERLGDERGTRGYQHVDLAVGGRFWRLFSR